MAAKDTGPSPDPSVDAEAVVPVEPDAAAATPSPEDVPAAAGTEDVPAPAETETADEMPAREPDRVALVSYNADGTPAQSPGFEVLPDPSPDPS